MLCRYTGTRSVSLSNSYNGSGGTLQPGDVFDRSPDWLYGGVKVNEWESLDDPRDRPVPTNLAELASECNYLRVWISAEQLRWSKVPLSFPFVAANRVVKSRLTKLIAAAVEGGMTDPPDAESLNEMKAKVALNKLHAFAALACEPEAVSPNAPTDAPDDADTD